METSLKIGFAQISLAAKKLWVTQNFKGAAAPLATPPPPHPSPLPQSVHLCYIFDAGLMNWSPEAISPFF